MESAERKEPQTMERATASPTLEAGDGVLIKNAPPRTLRRSDIFAATYNICNSWAGIAATLFLGIIAGGPVTIIYGLILASFMVGCCVLSMAELAARYPTAGGQYHWTWLLAPPHMKRGVSYITGVLNIFAWMAATAAVCAIIPSIVLGLAQYWNPAFTPQRWQAFLIYQVSNLIPLIYNVGVLRRAVWTHNFGMALSLLMMLTFFIACLARASPKLPSSAVWTVFVNNNTGWSDGIVFLTGVVNANFGFVGIDGAIHLAEDTKNAATAVPQALVGTVVISFVTAFPFIVAMFYCMSNSRAVLASPVPIFEIWRQGTRSDTGATAMTALLVLLGYFAINASQQTASRLTWSFARDHGLFFSRSIGTIHPGLEVPAWALVANATVVFVMGCVFLGSNTAFNAIVATSVILLHVTFAVPAGLKLFQRRAARFLPNPSESSWNFGVFGWGFDIFTVIWGVVTLIFYCFPTTNPTTGSRANYAAAVLAVMAVFAWINWFFYARKHYKGPRVDLEKFAHIEDRDSKDEESQDTESKESI